MKMSDNGDDCDGGRTVEEPAACADYWVRDLHEDRSESAIDSTEPDAAAIVDAAAVAAADDDGDDDVGDGDSDGSRAKIGDTHDWTIAGIVDERTVVLYGAQRKLLAALLLLLFPICVPKSFSILLLFRFSSEKCLRNRFYFVSGEFTFNLSKSSSVKIKRNYIGSISRFTLYTRLYGTVSVVGGIQL